MGGTEKSQSGGSFRFECVSGEGATNMQRIAQGLLEMVQMREHTPSIFGNHWSSNGKESKDENPAFSHFFFLPFFEFPDIRFTDPSGLPRVHRIVGIVHGTLGL